MPEIIDVYVIENSTLSEDLEKIFKKDKSYKLNIINQSNINFKKKLSNKICIFEEDSYILSNDLFKKILSMYKIIPASIIASSNTDIFNVVCWMREGSSDYILKKDLTVDIIMNSIKSSLEFINKKSNKGIFKIESKTKKTKFSPVKLPQNIQWEKLVNNKNYELALVMIEIELVSKNSAQYSKASIEKIYNSIKNETKRVANSFSGKLWFWMNNFGVLVFHFGDRTSCSVLTAISLYNSFFQICIERLKLSQIINFKIGLNEGYGVFHKTNTENITSDVINTLSHLTRKHTKKNCFNITENVFNKMNPRLQHYFIEKKTVENKKIYQYQFFKY